MVQDVTLISQARLLNNTIVGNTSLTSGGGLYLEYSSVEIINNIIRENTSVDNSLIYINNGEIYTEYSNIEDGWPGEGNFDLEPLFSDELYHLSSQSPCIDQGDPEPNFNDLSDPGEPELPLWPSQGTLRSQI